MLPMIVVLAIPIVPFLLFGERVEAVAARPGTSIRRLPARVAAVVIGLLATDIFLPIPSSLVSTLAGWQLGRSAEPLASWLGMSLGAAIWALRSPAVRASRWWPG